jgi:thiamine-monophosphate kinase
MYREEDIIKLAADLFGNTVCSKDTIVCGIGDDTAVLEIRGSDKYQLVTTDTVVAGTHFNPEDDPRRVARKAVAVNASDIAAMGGVPETLLVSATIPKSCSKTYIIELLESLAETAKLYNTAVIGGDTVGGPVLSLTITMLGYVEHKNICYRSGVKPGDCIAVTGKLGGSLVSGRHLDVQPRLAEARWLVEHAKPHAMMDISDGLAKDGSRMAAASTVSLRLDSAAIPIATDSTLEGACRDGEDFELLCACDPGMLTREIREEFTQLFSLPITVIGTAVEGSAEVYLDNERLKPEGYEHFEI